MGMRVWLIAAATIATFPGPDRQAASPDGIHAVAWEPPTSTDHELTHHLFLVGLRSDRRTALMFFFRSATIDWSPSGARFAVTCHCGSDFSTVTVFEVSGSSRQIDVITKLRQQLGPLDVLRNHHAYVESQGWASEDVLRVAIWGYGEQNPEGFDRKYELDLRGKARVVRARSGLPENR